MDQEYNWEEILSIWTDEELYQILNDKKEIKDKQEEAEKILLERQVIKKYEKGNYYRELIKPSLINFTAYNLRDKSEEETEQELINRGLNKASAQKLINFYNVWKKDQNSKRKLWIIIAPISIALWLFLEFTYDSPFVLFFLIIPLVFLGKSAVSITNFKKNKIFKIFEE